MTWAMIVGILSSGIRLATPYLYASVGETIGQVSGVLNLGVDGVMLMGAYVAFFVALRTGNLSLGLIAAAGIGGVFGLIMAFISVTLKAEQGISGIGLYLFGLGLSTFLFGVTIRNVQTIDGFPNLAIPGLSRIPVIGEIFFQHNILVYVAFALVPIAWFVLNKTPFGLRVRAVGQNPEAADSLGVSVVRVRYMAVTIGGVLSGVAGASLSIALLNTFQQNLTNGMGFIAVALVYFGGWRPVLVLAGALLFSTVNALQIWLQVAGINVPSDVALMLPYIVTILVLAAMAKRRVNAPAALNKRFERGES
ncbi:MAG TPA: ABC transporter permease [Candidatus Acetothermia bacterium]|nr:ABC transporter permease [Candidatus Acetothermia bacterium]